ncbi:MAG: DUF4340 domain-containing protein [Anaerolineales bacterium]|nr:DUF4340 domain-containing protein [Anaerolineales bacterium]
MANKVKNTARPAAKKSAPKALKVTKLPHPDAFKKPVFRTGTWLAILMLAALIGFAYYLKKQKDAPNLEATPTPGITYIFTPEDGLPSGIEIAPAEGDAQRVKVEHGTDGLWKLSLPFETEAEQGSAQAAADQIASLRMLGKVDAALDILGLDKPAYVINISFTGGKTHKLEVGSVTPTDSGYYTRVDGDRLVILSKDGIDALLNLQAFPPYLATPTPSPLPPTATAVPVIESATPTP